MLEFLILGPLEVITDGAQVHLGGPRQRAVVALLPLWAVLLEGGVPANAVGR